MAAEVPEITRDLTIPKPFLQQCQRDGKEKVAMREKEFGVSSNIR